MVRTLAVIGLVAALLGLIALVLHAKRKASANDRRWSVGEITGVASLGLANATAAVGLIGSLPEADPEPVTSADLYRLDGQDPDRSPTTRDGVGFIAVGDDRSVVTAELGPPARSREGGFIGNSTTSEWRLPGGGELGVTYIWGSEKVVALWAEVPPNGPSRFALHRGLVLGSSRLGDFVRTWGRPTKFGTSGDGDYVAAYSFCTGDAEVFMKLDQSARHGQPYGPALNEEIVTRAFAFYPDDSTRKC